MLTQAVMKVMEVADNLNKKLWQGFDPGSTDEDIIAAFEKRYLRRPDEILRTGGAALAGPISEAEHETKLEVTK